MEDGIADVVHVGREAHNKFLQLGADEEYRQMVLVEGFSIHLTFGEDVAVYHWGAGGQKSARGRTLSAAMHQFLVEHREVHVSHELRTTIIARFQAECPHDGGTYLADEGVTEKCGICHARLGSALDSGR